VPASPWLNPCLDPFILFPPSPSWSASPRQSSTNPFDNTTPRPHLGTLQFFCELLSLLHDVFSHARLCRNSALRAEVIFLAEPLPSPTPPPHSRAVLPLTYFTPGPFGSHDVWIRPFFLPSLNVSRRSRGVPNGEQVSFTTLCLPPAPHRSSS